MLLQWVLDPILLDIMARVIESSYVLEKYVPMPPFWNTEK